MTEIIPAIDIMGGRCIRLAQGDFRRRTIYNSDPVAVARQFEEAGLRRLHLVDIDGARAGRIVNLHVLEAIARNTSLQTDFSGGICTAHDLQRVYDAGAMMAGIGSLAADKPETVLAWAERYGSGKLLLGADVQRTYIVTRGWQHQTGLHVFDFIERYYRAGIRNIFCTDIQKDGMLRGPSLPLYRSIRERFPDLHLIASGGVSSIGDIAALAAAGCRGVIVGKALYEGRITPEDIRKYMTDNGTDETHYTLPGH